MLPDTMEPDRHPEHVMHLSMRLLTILLISSPLAACAAPASDPSAKSAGTHAAATQPAAAKPAAMQPGLAKAVFAGGCFWCVETAYEGKPGVKAVVSGFTAGSKKDPTYDEVSAGSTGHTEAVEITYDPKVIGYAKLLDILWHNIDPTQANGQFCDRGSQYRSGIYYMNEEEHQLAEASKRAVAAKLRKSIVTEIVAATTFYPAEEYHQDFWKKNPVRYFSYRTGCGRDARLKQLWGKAPETAH